MSDEAVKNASPAPESPEGTGQEESFAALLEKTDTLSEWLNPGQKVRAKVISITGDHAYIDLGGKSEGVVDLKELREDNGAVQVKVGDEVEAYFLTVEDGIKRLTTMIRGYSAVKLRTISDAHEAELPVNGEVKREIKGGFEVSVGGVRCFCPFSQIDLKGGREGGIYLGRSFPFKVLEFGEEGRNIVLSRRALLEEERQARIQKLKESLLAGAEVTGRVRSVQNFGAFVDLGGIDGLIPVSEFSWVRTERPEDVLSVGQEVTAKVLSLDWDNSRISLSLKATQPDPWSSVAGKYPVDNRVNGTIVRLAPFGAFVNLEPGVDGLIHISNLGAGRRINHPKEVVAAGQAVEAYVLSVDPEKRKISLSLRPRSKPEKSVLPGMGELIDGTVEKVMPYGVFLRTDTGLAGLVPNAEMGTPVGTDHSRMFPVGTPMRAVVVDVDPAQGRVRLSRKAVLERLEQEELQQYIDSSKGRDKSSGGLGSLGELLRAKMEEQR